MKDYTIYKPRQNKSGSASTWSLGSKGDCSFLAMAKQKDQDENGNARFDWDNKIIFKLGESDIGEILAVLSNQKKGIGQFDSNTNKFKGLFHSTNESKSILYFGRDDKGILRIYLTVTKGEQKLAMHHAITDGEAWILKIILCEIVLKIFQLN